VYVVFGLSETLIKKLNGRLSDMNMERIVIVLSVVVGIFSWNMRKQKQPVTS